MQRLNRMGMGAGIAQVNVQMLQVETPHLLGSLASALNAVLLDPRTETP